MRIRRFEKPVMKNAVSINKGDIIRFEYNIKGNWVEAIFESCNTTSNGVSTEIHIIHRNGRREKIIDTNRIEKVNFDVIGVIEKWD